MKFECVCKPVYCERNLPVEATNIHVTNLGRKGPMTCFFFYPYFFVHDYLAKSDGVFTELEMNSHSFIIWFDFFFIDSMNGSFTIDTLMPIVIFLRNI